MGMENKKIIETMESRRVLNALKEIKQEQKIIYVFGAAGTGKTTLIDRVRDLSINSVVLAPTGIAALNVNGQTIHSFFKLDWSPTPRSKSSLNSALIKNLELLIIDEISMVNASLMDAIDRTLKKNRKSNQPFGGVSLMLVGDIFQLEPVVIGETKKFFNDKYGSPFFFDSFSIRDCSPEIYFLEYKFRQSNEGFFGKLLDKIRLGQELEETFNIINKTCLDNFSESEAQMVLTGNNLQADRKNQARLDALPYPAKTYKAELFGSFKYKQDKEDALPAPLSLELKKGAQVRMTKNSPGKWANGSLGKVVSLAKDYITVDIDSNIFDVEKAAWEIINYKYDSNTKKIIKEVKGKFQQFPMRLGWASTIHKSQGLTLKSCSIDLNQAFCHGQTYVALSRCMSLQGINLTHPMDLTDVMINPRIREFHQEIIRSQKLRRVS